MRELEGTTEKGNSHTFLRKQLTPKPVELAERGRRRKPTGLLAPIHSPFRLQTWPPPHLPSLNFSVGGKRGGSGKDTAGPEMASGLRNCFLRLPFYFYYLGLVCKRFHPVNYVPQFREHYHLCPLEGPLCCFVYLFSLSPNPIHIPS